MGSAVKILIRYKRAFWRDAGYTGTVLCDAEPVTFCADAETGTGGPQLVCSQSLSHTFSASLSFRLVISFPMHEQCCRLFSYDFSPVQYTSVLIFTLLRICFWQRRAASVWAMPHARSVIAIRQSDVPPY